MTKNEQRFQSGGQNWLAFNAKPENPKGALIMIHEIWGLNDDIRRIAADFTEAGYQVVAPDLYSQEDPVEQIDDGVFARVFGEPFRSTALTALHDLKAWLNQQGWDDDQIAITGFCFGGTYALLYLLKYGDLAGAISFYGQSPESINNLDKPILAFFGNDDDFLVPHRQKMQQFAKDSKLVDVQTYDGAGHSFMNKYREGSFRPAAATDATKRTLDFLAKHLRQA